MTRLLDLVRLAADNPDGLTWYDTGRDEIETVCRVEGWEPDYTTGILAVTSPRVSVRRNVRQTLEYLENRRFFATTMRNVRRSVQMWDSDRLIRGRKTGPFYRALRGDRSAVVLDTHIANLFGVEQKLFQAKGSYAYYAGIVTGVAEILRISPRDCQACLWFGWKRSLGENPEPMPVLAEYRNWLHNGRSFPTTGRIDNYNAFLDDVAGDAPVTDVPF